MLSYKHNQKKTCWIRKALLNRKSDTHKLNGKASKRFIGNINSHCSMWSPRETQNLVQQLKHNLFVHHILVYKSLIGNGKHKNSRWLSETRTIIFDLLSFHTVDSFYSVTFLAVITRSGSKIFNQCVWFLWDIKQSLTLKIR